MAVRKKISDMTLKERQAFGLAVDALKMIEHDIHDAFQTNPVIPQAWQDLCVDEDPRHPTTTRVTLRLDSDVVKFFRTMGPGYQPRINRVLRAFMELRRAKVLNGPDTSDYITAPDRIEEEFSGPRPQWGDTHKQEADSHAWLEQRKRAGG
ncbi:MAG: BrnA antitoxin family protein [Pseudomonadota bacterium]